MPVKKATPKKSTTAKKASAPVKTATKKPMKKGASYSCEACGLVVTVDEACGCAEVHEIVCCGEAMKPATKVKVR